MADLSRLTLNGGFPSAAWLCQGEQCAARCGVNSAELPLKSGGQIFTQRVGTMLTVHWQEMVIVKKGCNFYSCGGNNADMMGGGVGWWLWSCRLQCHGKGWPRRWKWAGF